MRREPVVAGQFYPGSPGRLRSTVEQLLGERGAAGETIGAVMPHAGYVYSGAVAGATAARIKCKKTIIIMGPNHTGQGSPFSIVTEGFFLTPLGKVKINSALAKRMLAGSKYLEEDERAQRDEHSIEVQLPFFQVLREDVEIVPLVLAPVGFAEHVRVGREVAAAVAEDRNEVVLIASSDLTHYEPRAIAEEKDRQAIAAILELDEKKLRERVERLDISMCGWVPVVSLLAASKELGAKKAVLIEYRTSGDVSGDFSSVVGYAGIIIT